MDDDEDECGSYPGTVHLAVGKLVTGTLDASLEDHSSRSKLQVAGTFLAHVTRPHNQSRPVYGSPQSNLLVSVTSSFAAESRINRILDHFSIMVFSRKCHKRPFFGIDKPQRKPPIKVSLLFHQTIWR